VSVELRGFYQGDTKLCIFFPKQKLKYERVRFGNRFNDDNQIKNNKNNFSRTQGQFFLTVGQNQC
jgi:hypothetical protein